MDPETLVVALIGAFGGGLITAATGYVRSRTSVRTAARLIYAELTADAAPVAYYCRTGTWPDMQVARTAWDKNSEQLARLAEPKEFTSVYLGYAAIDAISYMAAAQDEHLPAERLSTSLEYLRQAITKVGERAAIRDEDVTKQVDLLRVPPESPGRPSVDVRGAPSLYLLLEAMQSASGAVPTPELTRRAGIDRDLGVEAAYRTQSIRVFDCGRRLDLESATLVRTAESPASTDQVVEAAYRATETASQFYSAAFDRPFINDSESSIDVYVHYGIDFCNAFWAQSALVIGDGDGRVFKGFTTPEILTHELSHSLPELAGLSFTGQTGSLVESICDVMGCLAKQWTKGETVAAADWIIGSDVLAASVNGNGLRSLRAPGTAFDDAVLGQDPQVATMEGYVETQDPQAGILINSGIPNHAFFLASMATGGHAWETIGRVWYDSLARLAGSTSVTFAGFARITVDVARAGVEETPASTAILDAWRAVGVLDGPAESGQSSTPTGDVPTEPGSGAVGP